MRILMLAQFYPPDIGGEERHVRSLSTALAARGHSVSVATLWMPGLPELELDEGVRVHRVRGTMQNMTWLFSDKGRTHAPPFPDPGIVQALRTIVAQERPQVVHAHNWIYHSFIPLKRSSGAKLVVTLHDYSLHCPTKRFMYRNEAPCDQPGLAKCLGCVGHHYGLAKGVPTTLIKQISNVSLLSAVDQFLAVSQAVADYSGLEHDHVPHLVVPNFVPDQVACVPAEPHPALAQLPDGDFLLFVGDASRQKGIEVLLQAYEGLRGAPPLVVLGRVGPTTPTALPPNVHLLGTWPHTAIMQAWQRCLFGVAPSIWPDPCPTVAIEAMAMGRPVIVSRMGGLPDIVRDGATGYVVPPNDPLALREAMQQLLDKPELRAGMGQAAVHQAARFQAAAVVPRIEQVYASLLAQPLAA